MTHFSSMPNGNPTASIFSEKRFGFCDSRCKNASLFEMTAASKRGGCLPKPQKPQNENKVLKEKVKHPLFTPGSQQSDFAQLVVETENLRNRVLRLETENLRNPVLRLQVEYTCKICMDCESNVVFLPYGHICCCNGCANLMHRCPLC